MPPCLCQVLPAATWVRENSDRDVLGIFLTLDIGVVIERRRELAAGKGEVSRQPAGEERSLILLRNGLDALFGFGEIVLGNVNFRVERRGGNPVGFRSSAFSRLLRSSGRIPGGEL